MEKIAIEEALKLFGVYSLILFGLVYYIWELKAREKMLTKDYKSQITLLLAELKESRDRHYNDMKSAFGLMQKFSDWLNRQKG